MNHTDFSALFRVILIFVIMFAGIRKKMSVSVVFSTGSILLAVFFLMPVHDSLQSAFRALTSEKTVFLAAILSLIIIFGKLMEDTGTTDRIGDIFRKSGADIRIGLAAFPAIIGLLPVPGGAVFSAPMIKKLSDGHDLEASDISLINYWFRHIWEYLWPLYPGILLASSISGMGLGSIAVHMFPFTLTAIFLGIKFLPEKMMPKKTTDNKENDNTDQGKIFPENKVHIIGKPESPSGKVLLIEGIKEILPVLLVVVPATSLAPILSALPFSSGFPMIASSHEITMLVSLGIGILYLAAAGIKQEGILKASFMDRKIPEMILMVVSIMIFKGILEDTGAASAIGREIDRTGVPVSLAAMIIPFITGIVTGISVAFVGIALPVVISIANMTGNGNLIPDLTVLSISSGFMGVMLSPLHLSLILSNSYFKADNSIFYRKLWPSCAAIFIFGLIYFHILGFINRIISFDFKCISIDSSIHFFRSLFQV
jgi:hypothetical protein